MTLKAHIKYEFDLSAVRLQRITDGRLWLYTPSGCISGDDESWRELLHQLQDMLGDAPKEETPDPRGYVFVDKDGHEWGYRESVLAHYGCGACAERPFKTRQEAAEVGPTCLFSAREIKLWCEGSRVPPMPEPQP